MICCAQIMGFTEELLIEYDAEMANTRKMLERVPDDKLEWAPHSKSMTLARLASHVADFPTWALTTVDTDMLDLNKVEPPSSLPKSRAEIVAKFEKDLVAARAKLASLTEEALGRKWTLKAGDHTILEMPKAQVIRITVMNHMVHHRGQLSVYLRELNVPVPGMYGPSADEM